MSFIAERKCLVFSFAGIEVREREFSFVKAGEKVSVEPKAFHVLLYLLRNPQKLITKHELIDAVWNDVAVSDSSLTRSIAQLRKLLGDDPREPRYIATVQTVGYRFLCDVQVADESIVAVRTPQPYRRLHSLAVLPFANGTGPAEAEYLSEGISESLINLLSQFPDLRVVPRTSAFRYKGLEADLKKIGRELNVDAVLTGSMLQREDRLIVQTELVDVKNDAQIWGAQFNRKFDDIFELQEELARHICECLQPRLTPNETELLSKRPTENREAYLLYFKAMYYANKWSPDGIQKGIAYSKQAIDMDPLFARAYAALSYLYILVSRIGSLPPLQALPIAKALALRALEIEDTLTTAHASLAYIQLAYDWDWRNAGKESFRAIELAPNLPEGHYVRSQWCLVKGLPDEAIVEARKALNLDPLSLPNYFNLALTYHLLRQFDQAIEQLQKALELDSSFTAARQLLALSYAYTGKYQEAFTEAHASSSVLAGANIRADIHTRSIWGLINAIAGRKAEAREVLGELTHYSKPPDFLSATDCAHIYAHLGEKDQALEWLEKAYEGRASTLFYIKMRPMFEILYTDARFNDLLRRMDLLQ